MNKETILNLKASEMLDWLSFHDQAYDDFLSRYQINNLGLEPNVGLLILDFVCEHNTLKDDFILNFTDIDPEDLYKNYTIEDINNMLEHITIEEDYSSSGNLPEELRQKVNFVNDLKEVISKTDCMEDIKDIKYKIFKSKTNHSYVEYLTVTYSDDTMSIRNCTCDKCKDIFYELSRLLQDKYALESIEYLKYLNTDKYIMLS